MELRHAGLLGFPYRGMAASRVRCREDRPGWLNENEEEVVPNAWCIGARGEPVSARTSYAL